MLQQQASVKLQGLCRLTPATPAVFTACPCLSRICMIMFCSEYGKWVSAIEVLFILECSDAVGISVSCVICGVPWMNYRALLRLGCRQTGKQAKERRIFIDYVILTRVVNSIAIPAILHLSWQELTWLTICWWILYLRWRSTSGGIKGVIPNAICSAFRRPANPGPVGDLTNSCRNFTSSPSSWFSLDRMLHSRSAQAFNTT